MTYELWESNIPYYNFKIAELCNMCIDSNYRKQGIGMALYKEFEKAFREKRITHFTVTASFKNENAKAFYKKMGFAVVGKRPAYYRNPREDAYIMRKEFAE